MKNRIKPNVRNFLNYKSNVLTFNAEIINLINYAHNQDYPE
jgi:hypothetical protein